MATQFQRRRSPQATGSQALKLEFATGEIFGGKPTIVATRDVTTVDLKAGDVPQEAAGKYPMRAEWSGFLTPTETGDYSIGVRFQARVRESLGG